MIPYAKVNGPPEDWFGLSVFDRDGTEIKNVVEVSAVEGWLVRHKLGEDGLPFSQNGEIVTERIEGDFTIARVRSADA